MATESANMSGSFGSHYEIRTEFNEIYVGTSEENYSTMRADLWLDFDGSTYNAYTYYTTSGWININGVQKDFSVASIEFTSKVASSVYLGTLDVNVAHNEDGTCGEITATGYWNTDTSRMGSGSVSAKVTPTTIPRYSYANYITITSNGIDSLSFHVNTTRNSSIYVKITSPITTEWLNGGDPFSTDTTDHYFNVDYQDRASTKRLSPNTTYYFTVLVRDGVSGKDKYYDDQGGTTSNIATLTSVPNINIGDKHTITWNNPTSDVTLNLKCCQTDGTVVTNFGIVTGTSKDITLNASTLYALTPKSNKLTLKYVLTTTKNSLSYTDEKSFSALVTNSNPTFSNFTYADTNSTTVALTGNNQILVSGYSNVTGTIAQANKATAKNSATMDHYKMTIGDKSNDQISYVSSGSTSGTISNVTNGTIIMNAVDSRGNSTAVTKTATLKAYTDIVLKTASVTRSNNGVGASVTLAFNGEFWNSSFGKTTNTVKTKYYKYKETSSSTWITGTTTLSITTSGNTYSCSTLIAGDKNANGFSQDKTFNILVGVGDELSTKEYSLVLGSGSPAIDLYGQNVALGGTYDESVGGRVQLYDVVSDNFDTIPVGTIQQFAGTETPNTWLLCDGSAISRTAYSELFKVIGTTYGSGDGSTTFNLPNLKGRVPIGLNTSDTDFKKLGNTGGEKTHKLTVDEMPSHSHTTEKANVPYGIPYNNTSGTAVGGAGGGIYLGETYDPVVITKETGGDGSHNNLQPYIVVNYIIKASTTIGIMKTSTAKVIDNLENTSTTDALSANQGKNLKEKIKDIYSTSEVKTNKLWIDGKSIYRKVVQITALTSSSSFNFDTGVSNIKELIDFKGIIYTSYGARMLGTAHASTVDWQTSLYYDKNSNYFGVETGAQITATGGYIIFEYTKTTD